MARIPRLYRVRAVHPGAATETRHYQGPEAARARADGFTLKDATAIVTVTPSHPVTYPHPAGDPTPLDLPDAIVSAAAVDSFLRECGLLPEAVKTAYFTEAEVVLEYQPANPKAAPILWRAAIV